MKIARSARVKAISCILSIVLTMQAGMALAGTGTYAATSDAVDPELSATLPSSIRVGDDYQLSVTTNSDGEQSIAYYTRRGASLAAKPTSAGNYYLIVSVAETASFNAAEYRVDYEIWKHPAAGDTTLTVPDTVYVGEDYAPQVQTISDGTQTFTYRYNDLEGRPERSEKPTEPGSYLCICSIAESDTYYEVFTYKSFRIIKRTPSATVSVPDTYVGETYSPSVTNDSDGTVTVTYCDNSAENPVFTADKPSGAGSYTVKVSVSETDTYYGAEVTDTFTISRRDASASITVPDTYVGESYEPAVTSTSGGTVSVFYSDNSMEEQSFTSDKPSEAGSYTAMAVISRTDEYNEATCTDTFTISKRTPSASVSISDVLAGDSYQPVLSTDSDGAADALIEYKPAGAPDSTYSTTAPVTKGTYTVRVTIPETRMYLGTSCTADFTISLKTATASVMVSDPYAGTVYAPVLTTGSDGGDNVVFEYKARGAGDDTYTTNRPESFGAYTVRATIPETAIYGKVICTADYNIRYLPAPKDPYSLSGIEGNNGFFTSGVDLKAPAGYTIAASLNGSYGASIPYSDRLNVIYLRRDDDGALTSAVAVSDRPMIDMDEPSFRTSAGVLADGSSMFADDLMVAASDDNLLALTVNGEPVDLEGSGSVLRLNPGNGIKTFTIVAVDLAGNTGTVRFTLMAEWLESRIIPEGIVLPLEMEESYNLDSGSWTVSGDTTVYNGRIPIYVNDAGDYTFTKVG